MDAAGERPDRAHLVSFGKFGRPESKDIRYGQLSFQSGSVAKLYRTGYREQNRKVLGLLCLDLSRHPLLMCLDCSKGRWFAMPL